jgi:hypothetical protein
MEISDAQLVLELAKEKMVKAVEYLENKQEPAEPK